MRKTVLVVSAVVCIAIAAFFVLAKPSELERVRAGLVASWRSVDDAQFVREFKSDGSVTDSYGGASVANDRWLLFTSDMPPLNYNGPLDEGKVYLSIGVPGSEPLYFQVQSLSENRLELIYLDRGGVLVFEKR